MSRLIAIAVCFVAASLAVTAHASNSTDALDSLGYVPWYDTETDQIRPISAADTDGAKNDTRNRIDGIVGQDGTGAQKKTYDWSAILESLGWGIVYGAIIIMIVVILYIAMKSQAGRMVIVEDADPTVAESETAERLERLPVEVRKPASNLLAEAETLMKGGQYNEAIVYLFSHQLVQLDKHQLLRLTRGKTNRQYLHELRKSTDLQDILRTTVLAFEDAFFGNHQITSERFSGCWDRLEEFHRSLASPAAGGAR